MIYGIMVLINPPDSLLMVVCFITADQISQDSVCCVIFTLRFKGIMAADSQCCLCPSNLAKYFVVPFTRCSYAGMLPHRCETDRERTGITHCYLWKKQSKL